MEEFIHRWHFVRSETLEILGGLTDEQLSFTPAGPKWQPLSFQFCCMGRTQLVYADAAKTGTMDFSLFRSPELPANGTLQTVAELKDFLDKSNETWLNAVHANGGSVRWPGFTASISLHISNLAEHERLHHGQLISYFTLAGYELPTKFKENWAL